MRCRRRRRALLAQRVDLFLCLAQLLRARLLEPTAISVAHRDSFRSIIRYESPRCRWNCVVDATPPHDSLQAPTRAFMRSAYWVARRPTRESDLADRLRR